MTYDIRNPNYTPEISVNHPRHLVNTVDFTSSTWNTVATHEVFTVTGLVLFRTWVACTESLAGGGTFQYGTEDSGSGFASTGLFMPATTATEIDAGRFLCGYPTISAAVDVIHPYLTNSTTNGVGFAINESILYNVDVGYEIIAAALTDGTLEFHCIWEPLTAGASVVIGAGGTL